MNIFEALRESHDRQRRYADALIQTSGDTPERVEAYKRLKSELQAHATAEERHFYMPLMEFDNGVDLSRHAISEHHEMDEMMEALDATEMSSPSWLATAKNSRRRSITTSKRRSRSSFRWPASYSTTNRKKPSPGSIRKNTRRNFPEDESAAMRFTQESLESVRTCGEGANTPCRQGEMI